LDKPASREELTTCLMHEISAARQGTTDEYLELVVVSSHCSVEQDAQRREAVIPVLDNWALNTAIRLADGAPVFRLDQSTYVFVRTVRDGRRWRDLLPARVSSPHRFVLTTQSPDGIEAGVVACWSVRWRQDLLFEAREQVSNKRLLDAILRQLEIAGEAVSRLNEMRELYVQGNHKAAQRTAAAIVARYHSQCGVAIGDKIRLSLLIGEYQEAQRDAEERMDLAPWDLDNRALHTFASLALGDIRIAASELERWPDETSLLDSTGRVRSPELALARDLVRLAQPSSGPKSNQWPIEEDISAMLQALAPDEWELSRRIKRTITRGYSLLRSWLRESPTTNERSQMRLNQLSTSDEPSDSGHRKGVLDQLEHMASLRDELAEIALSLRDPSQDSGWGRWKQRERLLRLVVTVNSLFGQIRPPLGTESFEPSKDRSRRLSDTDVRGSRIARTPRAESPTSEGA
jgi:hypothetical protein